jgi:hyaluronan synthase
MGKRHAQKIGFANTKSEIIVVADSDSYPANINAVREIVQGFKNPKVGGICGHTDVANYKANWLTRIQRIKYWASFDRFKRSEALTGGVSCLCGCFSAVRRTALNQVEDEWFNQKFLGAKSTYGEDRAMTNFMLKHNWDIIYATQAKALTIAPESFKIFWKQQTRWQKSYIREGILALFFIWKRPLIGIQFYINTFITYATFAVAIYSIFLLPIFSLGTLLPFLYLFGLIIVSSLYASNYKMYNNDRTYLYAPAWILLFAVVMIWRLPLSLVTLKDNGWKTR